MGLINLISVSFLADVFLAFCPEMRLKNMLIKSVREGKQDGGQKKMTEVIQAVARENISSVRKRRKNCSLIFF